MGVVLALNEKHMETVQDYREQMEGTELGKQLDSELTKASGLCSDLDLASIEVVSKEQMGHDGGDFNTGTEHTRVSEAMVATREGVEKVAEVILHEATHRGKPGTKKYRNLSEGFTQWLTLDTLQAANNSAYQDKVAKIDGIAQKLGRNRVREIGRRENPEVNLWMAYVHKLIEGGMELKAAAEEGNTTMQAAA